MAATTAEGKTQIIEAAKAILRDNPKTNPATLHTSLKSRFGASISTKEYSEIRKELGIQAKSSRSKTESKNVKAKKTTKKKGTKRAAKKTKAKKAKKAKTSTQASKDAGRRGKRGGKPGIRPKTMKKIDEAAAFLRQNPDGQTLIGIAEKFQLSAPDHRKLAFEKAGLPIPTRGGRRGPQTRRKPAGMPKPGFVPMPKSPPTGGRRRAPRSIPTGNFMLVSPSGKVMGNYDSLDDALNAGATTVSDEGALAVYERRFQISP